VKSLEQLTHLHFKDDRSQRLYQNEATLDHKVFIVSSAIHNLRVEKHQGSERIIIMFSKKRTLLNYN